MFADWEAIRRRSSMEAGAAANYTEAGPASQRQLRTTAAALPARSPTGATIRRASNFSGRNAQYGNTLERRTG